MRESGRFGGEPLADMQGDAGIPLGPVPVAPIPFDLAEPDRQLIHGRLDFLQTEDVGLLALEPFLELRLARPDPVDVPRGDLHRMDELVTALNLRLCRPGWRKDDEYSMYSSLYPDWRGVRWARALLASVVAREVEYSWP